MRHLREIPDDEVSVDILSYCYSEFRFMMGESIILEDFFDPDSISFFIWDFDPDKSESWDRCLDAYRFCLEGKSEVFFEAFDLRKSYPFTWPEAILYNCWSDTLPFHIDIDPKLEECFLDKDRLFFDLIG